MVLTWETLEATDLYRWFHLHEVRRAPGDDGTVTVHLQPGAFQEFIDLTFDLDAAQIVRRATLTLDRAWLRQPGIPAASGSDLAASFLGDLAREHATALDLANGIRQRLASAPGTVVRAGALGHPATLSPEVADALDAFMGGRDHAELRDALPHVTLDTTADGGHRTRIMLTYDATAPTAKGKQPMASISDETYLDLFVQTSDLPAGMTMPQDSRTRGADPGDAAFRQCGGTHAGLARWASDDGPINRLIDIRAVFPDARAATDYARAVLREQVENMPAIPDAPTAGENCVVVGGQFPDLLFGRAGHTSVCYLFTVGPVWVKLFAADYGNDRMSAPMVHAIAQNIARRIAAALPGPDRQKATPWWRKLFS